MNRSKFTVTLALGAALLLSGCAGADGVGGGKSTAGGATQSREVAANTAQAANNVPTSTPSALVANTASPAVGAMPRSDANGVNARAVNMPKPQVGSGGNDFYLYTQARAALNADAEMKGTNVIIDIKEGIVTLSGTVASAAQRSRAEQLTQSVGGVKNVKNQLRVSAGK